MYNVQYNQHVLKTTLQYYIVQCTMHLFVHIIHIVHCTLYSEQCTVYIMYAVRQCNYSISCICIYRYCIVR